MRNIFAFVSLAMAMASCSQPQPKITELSGTIKNLNNAFITLSSKGVIDTIPVDDEGVFAKSFEIGSPSYFTIRADRASYSLFLSPNETLNIQADSKIPSADPIFNGSSANVNNLIFAVNNVFKSGFSDIRSLYLLPKETFNQQIDSVKTIALELIKKSDLDSKHFINLETARVDYRIKGMVYDYPTYNSRLSGVDYVKNPDDFSFMDVVDMNDFKHLHIPEYANLLYKHFQAIQRDIINDEQNKGKSEFERIVLFFEKIDSIVTNAEIRDYLKHSSVIETIQWGNLEVAKNVVEHYIEGAKTESYRKMVNNAYAQRMLLAPGMPAPDFTLTGVDGKIYSLSDFRGKLVYLDFWATWCAPCRAEIPHLKTLKEAYNSKPVAFIAISLDEDRDKEFWMRMVKEQELRGYQLHAEKAWQSETAKKYQIKGIPTFVLIDGDGNIIEYNAPRPSNPEISLLLDKHIKLLN